MKRNTAKNYYDILGVSKTASADEIKEAYRNLCKTHHPDVGGDQEKMKDINEAYDILSDNDKRMEYDNPPQAANIPFDMGGFHFRQGNPFEGEINLNDILNNLHQFRFHGGFQQQGDPNFRSTQIISQRTRIPLMTALEGGDIMVFVPQINKTIKFTIPKGIQPNTTLQVRIQEGNNEIFLQLTIIIELPNLTDKQIKLIRKVLELKEEEKEPKTVKEEKEPDNKPPNTEGCEGPAT